jgi:riboflavin synthase
MMPMFTGLVEEVGTIQTVQKATKSASITIMAKDVLEETKLGDSICVNGVCLTVTEFTKHLFTVDVMAETMRRSNLYLVVSGSQVNLERALRVGDRFGGHMVSGHIDGMGTIIDVTKEENAVWISIRAGNEILKYVVEKGSIAIDGISLTVAYVEDDYFKVSIIPHTKEVTTLLSRKIGDIVNLECDVIGKYIEKLIHHKVDKLPNPKIDMEFLSDHGYI